MAATFFVLAVIAIHMAREPQAITSVWFANAAAIAILGTAARSRWPLLLAAMAGANLAANWLLRGNLALSASFVPGNVVEVAIGACLLQRFRLARDFDTSPRAFAKAIAAGGLLPQLAGATIGAATLHAYGFATFSGAWLNWYVDSTLGALAVLPLALALRRAQLDGATAGLRYQAGSPLRPGSCSTCLRLLRCCRRSCWPWWCRACAAFRPIPMR